MLKRKHVSKRSTNNSCKGRNSISGLAASAGNADSADSQSLLIVSLLVSESLKFFSSLLKIPSKYLETFHLFSSYETK